MKRLKSLLSVPLAFLIALPMVAQEERTIKRKVAIGRFSNETQYAKGVFYDKENDPMSTVEYDKRKTSFTNANLQKVFVKVFAKLVTN